MVRVPSVAAEAGQRLHREDEHLLTQRTRISNRIQALLVTQGVTKLRLGGDFADRLDRVELWNGKGLSAELKTELKRLHAQHVVFAEQLRELQRAYVAELATDNAGGGVPAAPGATQEPGAEDFPTAGGRGI